jgi:hypothetical protein
MKTSIISPVLFFFLFALPTVAQDRTTVNATSSEISDNLDLRAIASIFGDAKNLEDFERQLNDPKIQISNLDLNDDNQVDYLRVIESVEGNTHLIIVQSVLGRDTYQDVATIEVEKDRNNQVQVQVVGDVYMYGQNYIYEPVYVATPIIYNTFWIPTYRPYCSMWYWNYYPTFYYAWTPCPVFRYRRNVCAHINLNHHYNYVNTRNCHRALALYEGRRSNYCERNAPNRGFAYRNNNVKNSYELNQTRNVKNLYTRNDVASTTRNNNPKNEFPIKEIKTSRNSDGRESNQIDRSGTQVRNYSPNGESEIVRQQASTTARSQRANYSNATSRNTENKNGNFSQNIRSRENTNNAYKHNAASEARNESTSRRETSVGQTNARNSRRG